VRHSNPTSSTRRLPFFSLFFYIICSVLAVGFITFAWVFINRQDRAQYASMCEKISDVAKYPPGCLNFERDRIALVLQIVAGLGGLALLGINAWRGQQTERQLRLESERHEQTKREFKEKLDSDEKKTLAERFMKAVALLENQRTSIRAAGVYEIGNLMGESPKQRDVFLNLLIAFVREATNFTQETKVNEDKEIEASESDPIRRGAPEDIQAVVNVLKQNASSRRDLLEQDGRLENLRGADLSNIYFSELLYTLRDYPDANLLSLVDLEGGNLQRVDLIKVTLKGTMLKGVCADFANFSDSKFIYANGTNASFKKCTFARTYFKSFHAGGSCFDGSKLDNAIFDECNLEKASFSDVIGSGVKFQGGRLNNVIFRSSKLEKAVFSDVLLEHVSFEDTMLEEAHFIGKPGSYLRLDVANFTGANLKGAILRYVRFCDENNSDSDAKILWPQLQEAAEIKDVILPTNLRSNNGGNAHYTK
jgi:uncharacterized protein YjbI with pentapeptide repeats